MNASLSGYIKNISSFSKTIINPPLPPSGAQTYSLFLNRLRTDWDLQISHRLFAKVIYDNELLLGDYLKTYEFNLLESKETSNAIDLGKTYVDDSNIVAKHLLYRLYMSYDTEKFAMTIGKQRIALGTGRVWNPTDGFNPIQPTAIEKEIREGVDAINLEIPLHSLSKVQLVYARYREAPQQSYAFKYYSHYKGYDYSMLYGRFRSKRIAGFDFSGYLKDAGFRGETAFVNDEKKNYLQFVLSYDYAYPSTFYYLAEVYYNGGGESTTDRYKWNELFSGNILNLSKNYLYLGVKYDLTPLLKSQFSTIFNLNDASLFLNPSLEYSYTEKLYFTLGANLFLGKKKSEYGEMNNAVYLEMQRYF